MPSYIGILHSGWSCIVPSLDFNFEMCLIVQCYPLCMICELAEFEVPSRLTAPQYKAMWSVCLQDLPLGALFLFLHTLQVPPSRLTECLHQFIVSCTNGEHSNGCFQSRYTCVVCMWPRVLTIVRVGVWYYPRTALFAHTHTHTVILIQWPAYWYNSFLPTSARYSWATPPPPQTPHL